MPRSRLIGRSGRRCRASTARHGPAQWSGTRPTPVAVSPSNWRSIAPLCWNERPALLLRTCKTSTRDELMMMCGAQRALQGSGSVGYDDRAPPVRCQASYQRVPHGQGLDVRHRRQPPIQLADAKTVEPWLKVAVRATTYIAEGGRTHQESRISEATSRAGTTPCPRCSYVGAMIGFLLRVGWCSKTPRV